MITHALLAAAENCNKSGIFDLYRGIKRNEDCSLAISGFGDITTMLLNLVQIVLMLAGVLAVVMVIIGGLQYTISNGDPQKTAKAKNTILYALIGAVVSLAASAIIRFIAESLLVGAS